MFPRLTRVASGLSSDQWTEINERLENLEHHNQQLAIYCKSVYCHLEKIERRIKFLSSWLHALSDSNTALVDSTIEIRENLTEQENVIKDLIYEFKSLSIKKGI